MTGWAALPVNIQQLDLQHLLVLPILLPHFHPAAIGLAKLFITHPPHLILMYRTILDVTCGLGTDSKARASPLQSIAHIVDQTGRVRLVPLSTNQTQIGSHWRRSSR